MVLPFLCITKRIANKKNKEHNEKWPCIPDHSYKIMINGCSRSGKTNTLLNLIKDQDKHDVIDKSYLYAKDFSEPKYEYLIKKHENVGTKHYNDPTSFFSVQILWMLFTRILIITTQKEIKKVLLVFDEMIADIMTHKKFQAMIKEFFIRRRKLNISLAFITQSYFSVPKDARLNLTHYLIMKMNNKRDLQNIVRNHFADIDYKGFIKIYRECTRQPFNFLAIDATLPASNTLRFRKNLFDLYLYIFYLSSL